MQQSNDDALLQNRRILVVEDDLVNQKVAAAYLQGFGCVAEIAENGQQALQMLEEQIYDIVLMDCQMPVMDGFTATRQLREREQINGGAKATVIAMTANALAGDRQRCVAAGMDDYLSKPFQPQDLRGKLLEQFATPTHPAQVQGQDATVAVNEEIVEAGISASVTQTLRQLMEAKDFRFLVESYVSRAAGYIQEAKDKLQVHDAQGLHFVLHTLKGSSGNIGALDLAKLCESLDERAKADSLDEDFAEQLQALDDLFTKVRACLQRMADSSDSDAA